MEFRKIRYSKNPHVSFTKTYEKLLLFRLLQEGSMTVYIGGCEDIYNEHIGYFDCSFSNQYYMGKVGSATVTKIISNMQAAAHTMITGESIMLARKCGVDLQTFFNAIRKSAGNSYVFETEGPLIFNGTYDPHFTVDLHCKDLNMGKELAERNGVELDILQKSHDLYSEVNILSIFTNRTKN